MKQRLIALWRSTCNRETVRYVVFGTMTTVVDFAVYNLVFQPAKHLIGETTANLVANALAWCVAVVFSYAVNKWFVFCTHSSSRRDLFREMGQFFGSRVFSLLISEIGMFAAVTLFSLNENLSKAIVSVAVMIINYVFMKWLVFRHRDAE